MNKKAEIVLRTFSQKFKIVFGIIVHLTFDNQQCSSNDNLAMWIV